MTCFARLKFLWMDCEDGKARRERLKEWCSADLTAEHLKNQN